MQHGPIIWLWLASLGHADVTSSQGRPAYILSKKESNDCMCGSPDCGLGPAGGVLHVHVPNKSTMKRGTGSHLHREDAYMYIPRGSSLATGEAELDIRRLAWLDRHRHTCRWEDTSHPAWAGWATAKQSNRRTVGARCIWSSPTWQATPAAWPSHMLTPTLGAGGTRHSLQKVVCGQMHPHTSFWHLGSSRRCKPSVIW